MKEKTLVNMKHDLGKVVQGLHNTIVTVAQINTMVHGLLETVKLMPGYTEAIEKLKKIEEEKNSNEQEKTLEI